MISVEALRYLAPFKTLMAESIFYEANSQAALEAGDIPKWSYLRAEAQSCQDEASRRLYAEHGTDMGQRQKTWMVTYNTITPLI